MTNKKIWLGVLALALMFGMTVVGCGGDDGGGGGPQTAKYEGNDVAGNTYTLTITEKARAVYTATAGDSYELIITMVDGTKKTSKGTVETISTDGTFILQPSVASSETFSVVINNTVISSVEGVIAVEGGDIITPRTFNTIHLRANRYTNDGSVGEQWDSGNTIKLSDFVNTIPQRNSAFTVRMSGEIDNELRYFRINFGQYTTDLYYWLGEGSTTDGESISGRFENCPIGVSIVRDALPDYEIYVSLVNHMWQKNASGEYNFNYGITIPENIPTGRIMATITNFSISVVGDDDPPGNGGNPNSGGGTLTVTGIPSQYNGKYASLIIDNSILTLYGCQGVNTSTQAVTLVQIANGKADLPVWSITGRYDEDIDDYIVTSSSRYSGNGTFSSDETKPTFAEMYFLIYNTANPTEYSDLIIAGYPSSITFTNGSATIAWSSIVFDD
jgi:hypothetical protein